ncbi:M4 family metallopeptidase [Inconstantimicrobium mannanitabidum]|uniref:Peptidase M4 n=1 Tax=Inconstantimicrobium mannanitabidum TaxID=1604901 RepID=A0ACB5RD07_9CLOT|nr:M4 family metallopeptidase [Clostridium sp. TW13]GKX67047.1 peptidase M4 [Clostridium sp. TW13]
MKKKLLSSILAITVVSTFLAGPTSVKATVNERKQLIVQSLENTSKGNLKITNDKKTGKTSFISGDLSKRKIADGEQALQFLDQIKELLSLDNVRDFFNVKSIKKDNLGFTHVKLAQKLNGTNLDNGDITVHFNKDNVITSVSSNINYSLLNNSKSFTTAVTEQVAKSAVEKQYAKTDAKISSATKLIFNKGNDAHQAYKFNVYYQHPEIGNFDVYVDTATGKIIDSVSKIRYDGPVTGTGVAVNGTTRSLNLYQSGTSYQTKDTTKPMTGQILTYTANNAQTEPGTLYTSSSSTISDKAVVSAHSYAGVVYDFYKTIFNRNSIDDNGMSIKSTAHYGSKYNNAFWDGTQMVYGDGDGTTFKSLSGDLDVVGHEMTHGVTSSTADLAYQDQSGALNESVSDVFGVLIQTWDKYNVAKGGTWTFNPSDWVVGDEIYTPNIAGDALRSLADPTLYDQPANMSDYVNTSDDNGGVHTNSGIPNKAAFLVAQAIGCEKTAKIYYRALTTYFNSNTDFVGAHDGLVQAATDLYGASGAEVAAINTAFSSVGVTGSSPSADTYEPNDSLATAYSIVSGQTYNSFIYSTSDVDYYKLPVTKIGTISISLTNLAGDYDLYLYNSSGTKVGSSLKSSTANELITYSASKTGTYYVKVVGYSGAYSKTKPYALKATF